MKPEASSITVELAGGKHISFETGKLAKQAHGAAVVRLGENVVLATATANADPREGIDFFPITANTPMPAGVSPAASSSAKAA
jgi:polyribonucleotide nucleotidyltransferase